MPDQNRHQCAGLHDGDDDRRGCGDARFDCREIRYAHDDYEASDHQHVNAQDQSLELIQSAKARRGGGSEIESGRQSCSKTRIDR